MEICSNEIHLWLAYNEEITSDLLCEQYLAILSQDEKQQYNKFVFDKHRHQYLITRELLRCVLSLYNSNIDPEDWLFKNNPYGKPSIHQTQSSLPLQFNLSHSKKIIVLALSLQQQVGVDIEYIDHMKDAMSIANSFFHQNEVIALRQLKEKRRLEHFFELWTLKEAYSKAVGKGLSIPLNSISFTFPHKRKMTVSCDLLNKETPHYYFWLIHLNNTHKLSVSLNGHTKPIEYIIKMKRITPMRDFTSIELPKQDSFLHTII